MGSDSMQRLAAAVTSGWTRRDDGWLADPDDVVSALAGQGFEEFKRELVRSGRDRSPAGGVWEGLHRASGAVASAIWVRLPSDARALVYVEIDGQPVGGRDESSQVLAGPRSGSDVAA